MIVMILGLQGSAKTSSMVYEMMHDNSNKTYFSNIITKNIPNNIQIKPEMIIKKEISYTPKGKEIVKLKVNREFWEKAANKYHGLNIVIDEAHSILNSRRAMNASTKVILDWIAMLRRVVGSTSSGYGRLYLVTQIERRLDIAAKEQATQARYYLCHYTKTCEICGYNINENNEVPEPIEICPICNNEMIKHHHFVEVWHFQDYAAFIGWKYLGKGRTYYKHYYIMDIESVFKNYNTLQWDNLITEI